MHCNVTSFNLLRMEFPTAVQPLALRYCTSRGTMDLSGIQASSSPTLVLSAPTLHQQHTQIR
eukprot:1008865-Amphidinium_carterae.1